MKEKHPDWMRLQICNDEWIVTPEIEQSVKGILLANYPHLRIVKVLDYDTKRLLEKLPLNALYGE